MLALASCGKNESSAPETTKDPVAEKEMARQDSIKKAEQVEIEAMRQDSIEASQIKGYNIKRLSGKHKYGGKTELEYESLPNILAETNATAKKEMWTEDKLKEQVNLLREHHKGGHLILKIERITIGSADTDNFTVIVKDESDKEIYREKLESSVANTPSGSDDWWNIAVIGIPKRIKTPFFVYVVDQLEDAPFKFEVTAKK